MPSLPTHPPSSASGLAPDSSSSLEQYILALPDLAKQVQELEKKVAELSDRFDASSSANVTSQSNVKPLEESDTPLAELIGRAETALPESVPSGDTSCQDNANTAQKELEYSRQEEGSRKEMPEELRDAKSFALPQQPIVWDHDQVYSFNESVYDAAIFVFTPYLGIINSTFIMIFFLVNVFLQGSLIVVLKYYFIEDPFPTSFVDRLKEWRLSEGHAYYYADPVTGVSLVARVCEVDPGLSLSAWQAGIIDTADQYLASPCSSCASAGQVVSNVAILLFCFICANEIRNSVLCFLVMWHVPRSTNAGFRIAVHGESLQLFGLSWVRLLWAGIFAFCRCALASLLAFYGSWWLAIEADVTQLLLNSSALGFTLEIDEMIFSVLAPMHVIRFMNAMEPLKLPVSRLRSFALPLALGICIILFMLRENVIHTEKVSMQLQLARDAICAPSTGRDFIVGRGPIDWLYYAKSVPYDDSESPEIKAQRAAIQLIVDQDPLANQYANEVTAWTRLKAADLLDIKASMTMSKMTFEMDYCEDLSGSIIGHRLYIATGDEAFDRVVSCAEVKAHCTGHHESTLARNVRLMCPVTCGCADPESGMWHLASRSAGCPAEACIYFLMDATREYFHDYGCQDKSVNELEGLPGWSTMLHLLNESGAIAGSSVYNLSTTGCNAIQSLPFDDKMLLCGTYNYLDQTEEVWFGAGVMCPESCGCYYDYGADPIVPVDRVKYFPGCSGICPQASCYARYYDSALEAGVDLDEVDNGACQVI